MRCGRGGGVAPVRAYFDELLPDVLSGAIDPGRVFDLVLPLDEAPEALEKGEILTPPRLFRPVG